MNIVFMGNPDFAVPTLQSLAGSKHKILAVVTNPSKPSGRGRKLKSTAIADAAVELGLNVFETDDLKSSRTIQYLMKLNPDVIVVVAYKILPKSIIAIPKHGAINLHGSLLPEYRGAAPIQWALINGDKITGLTTFLIQPKVDHGDILLQRKFSIMPNDNYGSLSEKMSKTGAELMVETVTKFDQGKIITFSQDDKNATAAPKISKELTIINWNKTAKEIHNLIRGLSPNPGAQTNLARKRLKIFKSDYEGIRTGITGKVLSVEKDHFIVQTGAGFLKVYEVQIEGKKRLSTVDFLMGFRLEIGARFT